MRKLRFFPSLLFSFILMASIPAVGQVQRAASIFHDVHEIKSQAVKETRRILVHKPLSYERSEMKYPVIYMLDGHTPQVEMMAGILAQQAWGRQIPELILVSIRNTNRSYDMTPTVDEKGGRVGGANKFLDFIEKDVIPLVESNYRTQPFRIFAGHSLGGLAVVYSFTSRPKLFDAYIAASPVLHYDKDFVINESEKVLTLSRTWNKTMFLGLGNEPGYKKGWQKFQKLLKEMNPKGFRYEFREFPEENHASVVLPSYYWGLRKIYRGWLPKQTGTVAELEAHYRKLSERYGYKILIPEKTMNDIGYQFLRGGKTLNAIDVFKKNVANYPNSANTYDSLGEAYEKSGSKRIARTNYKKALDLAIKNKDEASAKIFKAHLERVSPERQ